MTSVYVDLVAPTADNPEKRIDKETINKLPLGGYKGKIVLVTNQQELESALEELKGQIILGFDTESRPSFRKGDNFGVSLLQLAGDDAVYLFQLAAFENLEPLYKLLEDRKVIKAGVAIHDDIKKLKELHPLKQGGFVEIADCTQKAGIINTGLRSLVAYFLGFRISKRAQVTNWARKDLTEAQIQYAATDAWVSRELYLCCKNRGWI